MCGCSQRSDEDIGFPAAKVPESFELPDMDAGNQT